MSLKGFRKSIAIIVLLGVSLGGIAYGVNMMNTLSQLKADSLESLDQLQETQRQLSELSEDFQLLQESYENQLNNSGPRYTGNPFATELWPGQLQSENITGMHWYSYYGGELVNVTDNVLGLGAVPLEGDYTSWTHKWTQDTLVLDDVSDCNGIFTDTCFHLLFAETNAQGVGGTRKRHVVLSLEDGSITYASPSNGVGYIGDAYQYAGIYKNLELTYNALGYDSFSVMGKYMILTPYNETSGDWDILEVWKESSNVWTAPHPSTFDPVAWMWFSDVMRGDGKYIIGLTWGNNFNFVCFEGV